MNVLTNTGECVRLTPKEAEAMKIIYDDSCNYYLDLSAKNIPLDTWHTIEDLFLADKVFPTITTIDIRKSNIKLEDVNPLLKSMIIY